MAATDVQRVIPLTFGWEHLPKRISTPLGPDPERHLRYPVPGLLVDVGDGYLLFDTGFNTTIVNDPALYERFWGPAERSLGVERIVELAGDPGRDPVESAFELVGIDPAEVVGVVISHFHNDHAGGLRLFADRVPVHVQRAEHEYAFADPARAERDAMHAIDYDHPRIDWRLADGDVELAPGVTAVQSVGHTPGHQSLVVELPDGSGYVFAADAADLVENIEHEQAVTAADGRDPAVTVEAIRRLKAIAAERGFRLVPGHDPEVWPAFAAELGVPAPT
jgi:glyoxylase-like metal-dependent hydrolase (beta-lactamase superfamily II)